MRSCARTAPTRAPAFPIRSNTACGRSRGTDAKLWIEDIGRWFAGPDGKPARAHGVVRVINERHEQEERLAYLSRFDALTGEINRWHLTERARRHASRRRSAAALVLRLPAGRDRQSRPHQRGLRLRRRRRGDRRRSPSACARRCAAAIMLGRFSGNKFGIILKNCTPDDMRHRRRAPARRRARRRGADRRPARSRSPSRSAASPRRAMPAPCTRCWRARRRRSTPPRRSGAARSTPIGPTSSARRSARENVRATDEIVTRAQRAAHPARLRAGGGDRLARSPRSTNA